MSENIFTELYNKILGLFGQTVTKEESKNTAVNRLRLVLMQDRTNLTPEIMHKMRTELIGVLSKYVELDKEALELNFEQEGEQMALMLSIPVIRAKDEEEIEQALKESEQKDSEDDDDKEEETDNTDEESENSEEQSDTESKENDELEETSETEEENIELTEENTEKNSEISEENEETK